MEALEHVRRAGWVMGRNCWRTHRRKLRPMRASAGWWPRAACCALCVTGAPSLRRNRPAAAALDRPGARRGGPLPIAGVNATPAFYTRSRGALRGAGRRAADVSSLRQEDAELQRAIATGSGRQGPQPLIDLSTLRRGGSDLPRRATVFDSTAPAGIPHGRPAHSRGQTIPIPHRTAYPWPADGTDSRDTLALSITTVG